MLKSFFYFFYNFYSKVLKESDPVFITKLVHGFVQSLFLYVPLHLISLFVFDFVLSKWIGFVLIIFSIAVNFKLYNSRLVKKVISEKPFLFENKILSNMFIVLITISLLMSVLISASVYGR
jgi:hypothetical protein